MKLDFKHESVLLHESIEALTINPSGIYVDGTTGGAGHSSEIAQQITNGKLIAIDKDKAALKVATERLAKYPGAQVIEGDFRNIKKILGSIGIDFVDGVLLDLGISSYQIDNAQRGFSYRFDAPLDMRMSEQGKSAYDVVNEYSVDELTKIIREYGEEKFAYRIAKNIETARNNAPVETTTELAEIIKSSIPAAARRKGGNPSKRTFQAIRIEVNSELDALKKGLNDAFDCLNPKGRLAIITFHSLEDRIVKTGFKVYATGCVCPPEFPICVCGKTPAGKIINRKAIIATESELENNKRSRSAKLRIIEKV